MSRVKIIKKNDEYSLEYNIGDICEVTGTWFGGVHIAGKTGIPVSLDREEYVELPEEARFEQGGGEPEPLEDEVPERDIEIGDLEAVSRSLWRTKCRSGI